MATNVPEQPSADEVPKDEVTTDTAFQAPTRRDPEQMVREIEELPQSEETAQAGDVNVYPGAGIRELKEENPDKSVEEIVAEKEPVATETEAWPPRGQAGVDVESPVVDRSS
jgi:hypothetical protein